MATDLPESMPPVRILLVDDHPAVRDGLALLLGQEGMAVCADASTASDALAQAQHTHPTLALVDLSLGGEDGLALVEALQDCAIPTLVYSMHEDARHVEGAFAAGALGYVTKREVHRVLVEAIHAVAAGRRFVSPNAAIALSESISEAPTTPELSDQERQVYRLLGQGDGTRAIAEAMGISERTVESYYARIQDKLGVKGMRELHRHAIAHHRQAQ